MTAYHAVFADGPVAGKTILVTGGAGAVGFMLCRWRHGQGRESL